MRLRTTAPPPLAVFFGALGSALLLFAVVMFVVVMTDRWPPKEGDLAGCAGIAVIGSLLAYIGWLQYANVSYLRLDEAHGTATYVERTLDRASVRLDELGPLRVEQHPHRHLLRAAGLPDVIVFQSPRLLTVEQRRLHIERVVHEHVIRHLLLTDAPDAGAFRDDDIAFRARTLVPDRVRLNEALDALARDPELSPRVAALRAALRDR